MVYTVHRDSDLINLYDGYNQLSGLSMIDHSKFIAKYHKGVDEDELAEKNGKRKCKSLCVLFAALSVYSFISVLAVVFLDISLWFVILTVTVFITMTAVGFYLKKYFDHFISWIQEVSMLRKLMQVSNVSHLVTDIEGRIIYSNDCAGRLFSSCGFNGKLVFLSDMFGDSENSLAGYNMLVDQVRKGVSDHLEIKSPFREDAEKYYSVTAQPVPGDDHYVYWKIEDVTEKMYIDRAIREEREKLVDFTDNAPVGFFSTAEDGRFVFVNATFARWLGESIENLLSRGRLHNYIVDPPKDDVKPYDIISSGGARQIAEIKMKGQGGSHFMASVNQTIVNIPDGRVRTRGVVHDLTAEKAMRLALKASEDRFRKFFEEAPLGVALLDSNYVLTDFNNAFLLMLGFSSEDLDSKKFTDIIADAGSVNMLDTISKIEQGQQISPIELTLKGNNKNVIVQLHARKFKGNNNIVLHFIDITQQKNLETQFVQSQKMQAIGQLAGGVAHDFNNLLTAMIGFCDLLLLRHKPGDPSFSDIMQIKQNANRASNLVRQLLAFSRQQTLQTKIHDITDILTEVSHLLRRLIGANIELELVHGQNLGAVKVDEGQMEQVLINLAVNARDAMEGGGSLKIVTNDFINNKSIECCGDEMPAGRWVRIDVKDNGCGIDKENLDRILEPFFTTKEVGQGTGLGLATVYGIIRQSDGYLRVESKKGKGTTFSIFLPCVSSSDEYSRNDLSKNAPEKTEDLTGNQTILLVEDEDAVRVFSSRALANKGYKVLSAASGEAALEIIEQGNENIDLLISDVVMPNMDGPTLALKVREKNATIKIIFISGYTEDRLKEHLDDNVMFLPKPFTLKQLASKVKEALS